MNQERREKLTKISTSIEELAIELEAIKDKEVEADDAKPEHMQDSSAGDSLQEAFDNLESAAASIDDALRTD